MEPDEVTNRVVELLGQFAAKLVHEHHVPPEVMAKAAVALSVQMFMQYNTDDQSAAAAYLHQCADELDELNDTDTPKPPSALN